MGHLPLVLLPRSFCMMSVKEYTLALKWKVIKHFYSICFLILCSHSERRTIKDYVWDVISCLSLPEHETNTCYIKHPVWSGHYRHRNHLIRIKIICFIVWPDTIVDIESIPVCFKGRNRLVSRKSCGPTPLHRQTQLSFSVLTRTWITESRSSFSNKLIS